MRGKLWELTLVLVLVVKIITKDAFRFTTSRNPILRIYNNRAGANEFSDFSRISESLQYLKQEIGVPLIKMQKKDSSRTIIDQISNVDQSHLRSIINTLQQLQFSKRDIRWICLKFPSILLTTNTSRLDEIMMTISSNINMNQGNLVALIRRKPSIFSKSPEQISMFLHILTNQLNLPKNDSMNSLIPLLLAKPYLWDVPLDQLEQSFRIFRDQFGFGRPHVIKKLLYDKSCSIFTPAFIDINQVDKRIEVLQKSFGWELSQKMSRKYESSNEQLILKYPKLLITSPVFLNSYLKILQEEFEFPSLQCLSFQQYLRSSIKLFFVTKDLSILRLRCRIIKEFLRNNYSDDLGDWENTFIEETQKFQKVPSLQYQTEHNFYQSYLTYLKLKMSSFQDSLGSNYSLAVQNTIDQQYIDVVPIAWQLFSSDKDVDVTQGENQYHDTITLISNEDWKRIYQLFWHEIEYLELSFPEVLQLSSRTPLLGFPFSVIMRKLGLLAVSLGLVSDEIPIILKSQPSILGLDFEGNLFAKLLLVAQVAYEYCYQFEFMEYSLTLHQHSSTMKLVSSGNETRQDLLEIYRNHPVRRKLREFILQQPEVLAHSLARYDEGINRFRATMSPSGTKSGASWRLLNRFIRVPHFRRRIERDVRLPL